MYEPKTAYRIRRDAMYRVLDRWCNGNVSEMERKCGLPKGYLQKFFGRMRDDMPAGKLMQISDATGIPMDMFMERKETQWKS